MTGSACRNLLYCGKENWMASQESVRRYMTTRPLEIDVRPKRNCKGVVQSLRTRRGSVEVEL